MSAPRVLLVETLDAAGSDRADARQRRDALRALRASTRVVVLGGDADAAGGRARSASGAVPGFEEWPDGAAGLDRLRRAVREDRFDLVLVAAAAPGGGRVARALPTGAPVHWWPTGVAVAPGWSARLGLEGPGRPALAAAADLPDPAAPAGLAWSSVGVRPQGRGRLTLWDGEYLLAPLGLAGEDGSRLLAAFARLAPEWCGVDLVVLAEPRAGFEREARALGIGPRVHFVGRAAREAEWAWWGNAAGGVFAGAGAVSGGLVLRGLVSGCPLLAAQSDPPGTAIGAWLERHRCAPGRARGVAELAAGLTAVLERNAATRAAVEHGRALAAAHGDDRLPARLAAALPLLAAAGGRSRDAAA